MPPNRISKRMSEHEHNLFCLFYVICDVVPMDMDVRMKTVLLGAVFLIVSYCCLCLHHREDCIITRY